MVERHSETLWFSSSNSNKVRGFAAPVVVNQGLKVGVSLKAGAQELMDCEKTARILSFAFNGDVTAVPLDALGIAVGQS